MSWGEEQKKEIETIRERKITVKLSDADCDRLARKCGEHGLTIGELIENFVGDLVGGTYSNGSDERDYADQWFERCWFGMFPEPTLLIITYQVITGNYSCDCVSVHVVGIITYQVITENYTPGLGLTGKAAKSTPFLCNHFAPHFAIKSLGSSPNNPITTQSEPFGFS